MATIDHAVPQIRYIEAKKGHVRRRISNIFMLSLTGLITLVALIPLFWIVGYVIMKGSQGLSLTFFTQMPRPLGMEGGGVLHAIQGTILLTLLSAILAVPPGILAAIYAARYPNTPLGMAVRFGTDVLAGVPSIVIGLFVYALVVKPMGQYSALAGGIALALIMLPTIIRTTEEMLKLVPGSLREASLGLGASEWRTTLVVIVPAAVNGILTGIVLGLARASGETAPLLFTALGNERFNAITIVNNAVSAKVGIGQILQRLLLQPVDSLPLTLWKYASQPYPERVAQAWTVALVLMILVLAVNISTRLWISSRISKM